MVVVAVAPFAAAVGVLSVVGLTVAVAGDPAAGALQQLGLP